MKRLLWYLNQITESGTKTFRYKTVDENGNFVQKDFYDGECRVIYLKPNGGVDRERAGVRREPKYWNDGVSYAFDRTNKNVPDKPTVTVSIPIEMLGIKVTTSAAADFCLRRIKPYFDKINDEYANKARPDSENGKFIIYEPGGEVLARMNMSVSLDTRVV